jgi:hypothetical protein
MSMRTDSEVLREIDLAFGDLPRPDAFTDHPGCCECAEHDALLQDRERETLSIDDVGSQAWNPITMCTPQAFAYWFPALARLALDPAPEGRDWYGYIILYELRWDGPRNVRWQECTLEQRRAVTLLLEHLFETRSREIALHNCGTELLEALDIWSEQ